MGGGAVPEVQGGLVSQESGVRSQESAETWRRCRFRGLLRVVRPGRGWELAKRELEGKVRLALVDPRGPVWEVRVRGGWWLRRVES